MEEELDLVTTESAPPPKPAYTPETTPYDPARQREHVRAGIAYLLIGLLVGIIVLSFLMLILACRSFEEVKGMLELLLAPIVGLVGAVTGFYYGEKAKSQ